MLISMKQAAKLVKPHHLHSSVQIQYRGIVNTGRAFPVARTVSHAAHARTFFTMSPSSRNLANTITSFSRLRSQLLLEAPKWGFAIYRGVPRGPAEDTAWEKAIQSIQNTVRSELRLSYDAEQLIETFDTDTVIDCSPNLVSKANIRAHFSDWVRSDVQASVPDPRSSRARMAEAGISITTMEPADVAPIEDLLIYASRWQYCLYLDQCCLDSFISSPWPIVVVIQKCLDPTWMGEEGDSPPIEGCTWHDVGWMYMHIEEYVKFYASSLQDGGYWMDIYQRPPWTTDRGLILEPFGPEPEED